jgi:hypothetical protein
MAISAATPAETPLPLRSDVVDFKGPVVKLLGELTVFTAAIGPPPYLPDKRCIHADSRTQEAVRFSRFTPSTRRDLDFRMASRSPALPYADSSSFSAPVRASL